MMEIVIMPNDSLAQGYRPPEERLLSSAYHCVGAAAGALLTSSLQTLQNLLDIDMLGEVTMHSLNRRRATARFDLQGGH
jgi:hypothetical protein